MHNITTLAQRKSIVAAGAAILLGVVLIVRSALVSFGDSAPAQLGDAPLDVSAEQVTEDLALGLAGEDAAPQDGEPAVIVYVTGAVAAPDVYRLPAEARVKDLVLAAGGLTAEADMQRVNLAARVSDGEHIDVPRLGDAPPAAADAAAVAGGLIDINSASAAELDALPGIGPAIAERIVAYRDESGPFESVEALQDVKGVGAALFEQIAPLVTAGP